MKESYREGVANLPGPEPCEGSCKAALEALGRGICRLGIELPNRVFHDSGESYCGVVPTKQPNKSGRPPAEVVEIRGTSDRRQTYSPPDPGMVEGGSAGAGPEDLDEGRESATRLTEFGRYAAERRKKRGEGKPETFNLLGFTHICGTHHKTGNFTVRRVTIGKRMAAKRKDIRAKLRQRMQSRVAGSLKWLQQVVRGYFQYHAIPGNWARMEAFRKDVQRLWFHTLRRRSQRSRLTWEKFRERPGSLPPPVQILQPYPDVRFDAKHPHIRGKNRVR
jgi:hypothetical protein